MNSVAIVVPTYKPMPDADEQKAFERLCLVFQDEPIVLCHPENMDVSWYRSRCSRLDFLPMRNSFFCGIDGYNRLMTSPYFYANFAGKYSYILICQLDVWVFSNHLSEWIEKGVDYVGAPWHNRTFHWIQYFIVKKGLKTMFYAKKDRRFRNAVGNGGFSLRKVDVFFDISKSEQTIFWTANEDCFWSFLATRRDGKKLHLPTDQEAADFCIESDALYYMRNRTNLPMAVHAYKKHNPDFWQKFMTE